MSKLPPLGKARILVTNDDGIHANGMRILAGIARTLCSDVWIVAPESEQSAMSHSMSLRRPLHVRRLGPRRFSVNGTPTDCVLAAYHKILADRRPDLVLSGINHGLNLGEDVVYSGTVAAAMEAAMLGLRAVAVSQSTGPDGKLRAATPEAVLPGLLKRLTRLDWTRDLLINVNIPDRAPNEVAGIRVCRQGRRDTGIAVSDFVDPAGRSFLWIGSFMSDESSERDSDLTAVFEGAVAVTPLHQDLTQRAALKALTAVFK